GTPAARECRLQRVVMRVGIVSEDLETTVPVHPQEIGACNRVGRGACSNRDLASIGQCYEYGLGLSSELRLNIGSCFAQVHGMRSDIPNLKNPLLAQIALQSQVPLLSAWRHEMAWDSEHEQQIGRHQACASGHTTIVRELGGVSARKVDQLSQTRDEAW